MKYIREVLIFLLATLVVLFVLFFAGQIMPEKACIPTGITAADDSQKSELLKYQGLFQDDLTAVFDIAHDSAVMVSGGKMSGLEAQNALDSNVYRHPSVITIGIFDKNGIITAMSPASHSEIVGLNLSLKPVVYEMNNEMIPQMTDIFPLAEGGYAAGVNYPIFSPEKDYAGFISLTFDPAVIAGVYSKILMDEKGYQMMIVQKDGVVLYDTDPEEIGKETFGNPLYDDFPEILEFAKAYSKSYSGEYEYSYLDKELERTVDKKAFWTTIGIYGAQWRLIIIREI